MIGFAAEIHGEPQSVGNAVALLVAQLRAAGGLDIERRPWRVNAVGKTPRGAHEACRARVLADTDQHAVSGRPGAGDRPRLHFGEQLLVHPLGGAAQRKLAQRDQIGGREEMHQRAFGLQRNVDFAFFEPLDQIVRREVDQLHRVGAVEYRVRYQSRARGHA